MHHRLEEQSTETVTITRQDIINLCAAKGLPPGENTEIAFTSVDPAFAGDIPFDDLATIRVRWAGAKVEETYYDLSADYIPPLPPTPGDAANYPPPGSAGELPGVEAEVVPPADEPESTDP